MLRLIHSRCNNAYNYRGLGLSYYTAPPEREPVSDQKLILILGKYQDGMVLVYQNIEPINPYTTVYLNKLNERLDYSLLDKKVLIAANGLLKAGISSIGHLEGCMIFDYGEAVGWEYYAHIKSLTTCHSANDKYDNKYSFLTSTNTNKFIQSIEFSVEGLKVTRMIDDEWAITHNTYID